MARASGSLGWIMTFVVPLVMAERYQTKGETLVNPVWHIALYGVLRFVESQGFASGSAVEACEYALFQNAHLLLAAATSHFLTQRMVRLLCGRERQVRQCGRLGTESTLYLRAFLRPAALLAVICALRWANIWGLADEATRHNGSSTVPRLDALVMLFVFTVSSTPMLFIRTTRDQTDGANFPDLPSADLKKPADKSMYESTYEIDERLRKETNIIFTEAWDKPEQINSEAQVADLVTDLRTTFKRGVTQPVWRRKEALLALRRMVVENEAAIIQAINEDLQRPLFETSFYDLDLVINEIDHLIDGIDEYTAPRFKGFNLLSLPSTQWLQPQPLGEVLVIGTWNFPVMLLLVPTAGALAAGNTVVMKPCNVAASTAALMCSLIPQYMDRRIVGIVGSGFSGDRTCTGYLLKHKFDKIFFTGSPTVGKVVARAAAEHLTPCLLELGGKNPVYVDASADLDMAAKRLVWARNFNCGQQCISPDFVLCDEEVIDRFCEHCQKWALQFYGDDPRQSKSIGRIVGHKQMRRITQLLAETLDKDEDCTVVCGGDHDPAGLEPGSTIDERYIAPTVLRVSRDSPLMKDEIFGPILLVTPVSGVDDAVAEITGRPKPLAAYVFAEDSGVIGRFTAATSSGGVTINSCLWHTSHDELPFGGIGDSGMGGGYHGAQTFEQFSHAKPVLHKSWLPDCGLISDPFFVHPPFSWIHVRIVRLLSMLTR